MDILINAAVGLIGEVVKYTVLPIKRHVCYFFNHKSKVNFLNDQLEKLKDKKQRLQHSADSAIRNGLQIEQDVQNWITDVDKQIREDEEELRKYEDEAKKRCFIPFCPDFMSRYHLSRKSEKEADLVVKLLTEANQFPANEISVNPNPQLMVATSAPQGFVSFKSREVVLHDILNAFKDPNSQKIGVYGIGGVGKTTLVKEVAAVAKKDNLFDEVAIATISNSQKTDIKKAQGEIGDALGFKFDQETESGRAIGLRRRLNNGKKILVILDDIWEKVDLEAAGIIFEKNQNIVGLEAGIKFERNQTMTNVGCKILMTSRNRDTLYRRMEIETIFEVMILSPEDSMTFFTKIVGSKVEEPDYKPVAIDVVTKCAGLPVAISAVANALKDMDIDIWKNALRELTTSNPTSIDALHQDVYSSLELSYRYLRSQEAKSLLMLCSMGPRGANTSINDLIKYSWGFDLLDNVSTLEEARGRMGALIHDLKACTLLLNGNDDTMVKMHDIIQDVIISISSKDNQMFVLENQVQMERMLRTGILENCNALSLPYTDIHELPDVLHCAELKLFLCFSKDGSTRIPDAFFEETKKLRALDLFCMEFSTLPSSFCFLTNLRTLFLDSCILQNVAIIGELKQLEVLSFVQSKIQRLPIEIAKLSKLKLFDLTECDVEAIPSNLLSSLHSLEELYMGGSFDHWDVKDSARLTELQNLSHLTALEIHIPDVEILPTNLFSENLERFKIFIGKKWKWDDSGERSRILKLDKWSRHGVETLLKKTKELCLHDVTGIMDVLSKLDGARTSTHLKDLHIENCSDPIQYLFYSLHEVAGLESLILISLMNLEKIYHGQFEVGSFNALKIIRVQKCAKMKNLLSFTMAMKLCQLQEIEVFDCENIVEIVHDDREEDINHKIEFCSLQNLKLKNLSKLIEFCNERRRHTEGEENTKDIIGLGSLLVPLFNHKLLLSMLCHLELIEINIPRIWDNQTSIGSTNLTSLAIKECKNLENLFSTSMARCLKQLKLLVVMQCKSMIEIIATDMEEIDEILFPNLDSLYLHSLPKLIRFSENSVEFSSLRELSIKDCLVLTSFISNVTVRTLINRDAERNDSEEGESSNIPTLFDEKVSFPKLEGLTIDGLESLRKIWHMQLSSRSFNNITYFCLRGCHRLLNIFSINMLGRLQRLCSLDIGECNSVDEIFECEELNLRKSTTIKFELPDVTELFLWSLPKLKSFSCKAIECPSLSRIHVRDCNQVQLVFCSKDYISSGKPQEEEESQQPLFWVEKVSFPKLRIITIIQLKNMKMIWDNQIPANLFANLKELHVICCEKLMKVFSSNMVETIFVRVEKLFIARCHSLEEIFEVQGLNLKENHVIETKLRKLGLRRLPKLKQLWNKDSTVTFNFENLELVFILGCWNLRNVFPISVARGLVRLEVVGISFCGIEEFLSKDKEEKDEFTEFVFPELTRLELWKVPKLRSFFPNGLHTILECPKLRILKTFQCGKLKMFTTKQLSNIQEEIGEGQLQMPYQQRPLFSTEKVIPKLEELSMDNNDIANQFPARLFNVIKALSVQCYHDESTVFPFSFLQSFHNLETLEVRCCKFKELFPYEGDTETLPPIRQLVLFELPELRHIWKEDLRHHPILENLETIEMAYCDTLSSVAPSSASFQNLTVLRVENCKVMKSILAAAACRSLVCLVKMRIAECHMVTEIIAAEGDEGTFESTFGNLEHLELDCLPNLTCFCSGNYAFDFPYLEKVIIKQCPGLKFFSKGVSNTPLLERVQQTDDEEENYGLGKIDEEDEKKSFWAGDLNSTIKQLYAQKGGYQALKYMDFFKYPELMDIWKKNLQEILDFKSLYMLEICNFSSFKYLFNHSMALTLVQLRCMTVRNCNMIENVIAGDGFDGSVPMDRILFPFLHFVFIDSCPDLKRFYLGKDTLEYLSLNEITVINCPKMINFASTVSNNQNEESQRLGNEEPDILGGSFFTDKVVLPSLVYLKLSSMDIQKIWDDGKLSAMSSCVQQLTDMIVEGCGNLRYLFPSSLLRSCSQIETLEIRNCNLLSGVIFMEESVEEKGIISTPTTQGSTNHFEFPFLGELVIENCLLLETFITNSLTRDMTVANTSVLWDEKVAFPSLEKLKLRRIAAKAVWHGQYMTANSLVHLTRMSIIDCEMVREIITCEPEEAREGGIVFYQLKYLELGFLPYLESFCSGECCFGFPFLEEVIVKDCPNMKTFTGGETTTPKLQRLKLAEVGDEELCEGSLNTTIKKLFFRNEHLG